MDYTTMGRMGDYVKNMRMESRWLEKKKTGTYTEKETLAESRLSEYEKSRRAEIKAVQEQAEEMNKNKDADLEKIMAKVNNGKSLTASEKEYLRRKNPQAYEEVMETEQAQKAYEEALKRCRTKEDVQRLKALEMGQRLSAVKSVMNNPNIPEGEKLGLVLKEYKKAKAALEVEMKFVESGAYDELPTEAEMNEAIQKENEIKKEELTGESAEDGKAEGEDTDAEATAKPDANAKPSAPTETDAGAATNTATATPTETDAATATNTATDAPTNAATATAADTQAKAPAPTDAEPTREQLAKEITDAHNKYKKVLKSHTEVDAGLYKIQTVEDLIAFGDQWTSGFGNVFGNGFGYGFEAEA